MTLYNIPKIIVICGPTGIGKTSSAIKLAQNFGGEIISADSMQIYQYMDIGTAKPTSEERAAVPHHLVDFLDPAKDFNAAQFARMGHKKVFELYNQKIIPFVAGGTGLYIKALTQGIFESQAVISEAREQLKQEAEASGTAFLYKRLQSCDPDAAHKIHPNDTYRIIRALEIYQTTGKTISEYHAAHQFAQQPFHVFKIGLNMDREKLYERINQRVDMMIEAGLLEEVQNLLDKGYSAYLKSMQSIGYRHMTEFIQGRMNWDEAVTLLKRDTRRYAKRQFTWFRADTKIIWTTPETIEETYPLVKKFLQ